MKIQHLLAVLMLLPLMACQQNLILYSDLTEREANEMLSLLFCSGLPAEKTISSKKSGNKVGYTVETSEAEFANAMMLLQANDLPRERFVGMGDRFVKSGPVSTALEEAARLNAAMSAELSATLSGINGVTSARVHLALPKKSTLTREVQASSAAVAIRHRQSVSLDKDLTKIKALVVDSIENLPYEAVTVVFFPEAENDCPNADIGNGAGLLQANQQAQAPVLMQALDFRAWSVIALLLFITAISSYWLSKNPSRSAKTNFVALLRGKMK